MSRLYNKAALGGTFDRFHKGHEQLLSTALSAADNIVVGIACEQLIQNKVLASVIETYEKRVQNVRDYVTKQDASNRFEAIALTDLYGPTLNNTSIDALVVSTQTKLGGEQINEERVRLGLPALPLIEATMIGDELGEHLSSTQIRQGLVTRSGRAYTKLFSSDIHFSNSALQFLQQPQGEVLQPEQISVKFLKSLTSIVLVGDTVTQYFIDHQLPFHVAIIDGKTARRPVPQSITIPITSIGPNPAGSIAVNAANDIIRLLRESQTFPHIAMVEGEEDLLAFVPTMVGPLGGAVFYGQPNQGIVMIRLTEAEKIRLARLINPSFE